MRSPASSVYFFDELLEREAEAVMFEAELDKAKELQGKLARLSEYL